MSEQDQPVPRHRDWLAGIQVCTVEGWKATSMRIDDSTLPCSHMIYMAVTYLIGS
jgi:hypothetical protein